MRMRVLSACCTIARCIDGTAEYLTPCVCVCVRNKKVFKQADRSVNTENSTKAR